MPQAFDVALSIALSIVDEVGALTPDELTAPRRAQFLTRRQQLRAALASSGPEFAISMLATLASMASARESTREVAAALMRQDVEDLRDLPAFALADAVRAFRRGDLGDGHWRPTAGEICKEARRRSEPHYRELHRLGRVLDAPLLERPRLATPEQRAAVRAGFTALMTKFSAAPPSAEGAAR